jgi:hypothetical protein
MQDQRQTLVDRYARVDEMPADVLRLLGLTAGQSEGIARGLNIAAKVGCFLFGAANAAADRRRRRRHARNNRGG